ncbi:GIY-YIG nuclease family protein [Salinimonas chungwhensis]|uniref:GIY-YIG nuclease family protein n=1 Tax=Salinimonas chungwhensis TaxID=265425 RepID=UPI0003814DA3|nr:GIY-YIG nuclease family protein [Salinimonas chungwhensis]
MAGYIYHTRPQSNSRFCKVGLTKRDSPEHRVREINRIHYGGFSDWILVSHVIVKSPELAEKEIHLSLSEKRFKIGPEQEVFLVPTEDVETLLQSYQSITYEEHLKDVQSLRSMFLDEKEKYESEILLLTKINYAKSTEVEVLVSEISELKKERIAYQNRVKTLEEEAYERSESAYSRRKIRKLKKMLEQYQQKYGEWEC